MSKCLWLIGCLGAVGIAWQTANGEETSAVKHEVFNGYFVSNEFEPNAAESFVAINAQERFDKVFGVAFVMGDKSKRLPKDAFSRDVVFGMVKRGMAIWDFQVLEVVETDGKLEIRYTAKSSPQANATFANPLIVGVPKKDYKSVTFIENRNAGSTPSNSRMRTRKP
jgi:hypothetical protein